jgi:hypothetical protein
VAAHSALPEDRHRVDDIYTDAETFAQRTLVLAPIEGPRVAPVAGGGIADEQLAISAGPTSKWALVAACANLSWNLALTASRFVGTRAKALPR